MLTRPASERPLGQMAVGAGQAHIPKRERLSDLDVMKRDFVASVSYELRTPLATIAAVAELLADGAGGAPPARQAEMLAVVRRSVEDALCQVDDLLFLAQVDAGCVGLDLGPIRADGVVREAVLA